MLTPELLTPDQQKAVTALYESDGLLLYGRMGTGKTIIAGTAVAELIKDKVLKRVLIVTTPKIAKTVWKQELAAWSHTSFLNVGIATGRPDQRNDIIKNEQFNVVVLTFNTLVDFLSNHAKTHTFDGLVIDESSKLKAHTSKSFKKLKPHLKTFSWRTCLTGTPTSEDFMGLYSQMTIINPELFGRSFTRFRDTYFFATDYMQYNWELRPNADKQIADKIKPFIHVCPDYRHTLPKLTERPIYFDLTHENRVAYEKMKKDSIVGDVVAVNAAVTSQKLQQLACGFMYEEENEHRIANTRVEILKALLSKIDTPVLVAFWFQSDLHAIQAHVPNTALLDSKKPDKTVAAFNAGEVPVLLAQAASISHGIQLQKGPGHTLVIYSPLWSNDINKQLIARIWRQGQQQDVDVYNLLARDTVDELIIQRIENKDRYDTLLNKHLKGE